MLNIEFKENLDEEIYKFMSIEFDKFAVKNNVECNYKPFAFVAKEDDKLIGLIEGHSYYKEVYISNLIVLEEYRKKGIGSKLMEKVENYFQNKGFENMNLTTRTFQAPGFYEKCGFELEFIRENKENPELNKYFFVKYF